MTNTPTTTERLARAEILAQISKYSVEERDILKRLIATEKSSGPDIPALGERAQKVRDRARARLNGHAAQLLRPSAGPVTASELRIELDSVRLILEALNKNAVEAATVEALERAEQLAPTERGLVRDWALATARWLALTERLDKFYDEAGGDVTAALPLAHLPARSCEIETHSSITIEGALAKALETGAVSAADLRKARSV